MSQWYQFEISFDLSAELGISKQTGQPPTPQQVADVLKAALTHEFTAGVEYTLRHHHNTQVEDGAVRVGQIRCQPIRTRG